MQAGGGSWTEHRITRSQVLRRMAPVEAALPDVWPFVVGVIDSFARWARLEGTEEVEIEN